MTKKPNNAQASTASAVAPVSGAANPVANDQANVAAALLAGTASGGSENGGSGAEGRASDAILELMNSAPATGDASAGKTEVGGGAASSSEGAAASSGQLASADQSLAKPIVPDFLDRDGKVRVIGEDERLTEVKMEKSVKIDGAFLEVHQVYSVPLDIWSELDDLDALVTG